MNHSLALVHWSIRQMRNREYRRSCDFHNPCEDEIATPELCDKRLLVLLFGSLLIPTEYQWFCHELPSALLSIPDHTEREGGSLAESFARNSSDSLMNFSRWYSI